jgi:hypothetical protein
MPIPSNSHAEAAIQLLVWAIEEIEKADNPQASCRARTALRCMQWLGNADRARLETQRERRDLAELDQFARRPQAEAASADSRKI